MLLSKVPRPSWRPYLIAIICFGAAVALRLPFVGGLGTRTPYITFFPAVMVTVLFGGIPAGLLVTLLSALYSLYFSFEPVRQFSVRDSGDLVSLALFLVSCTMVSALTELARRAQLRASEAEAQVKLVSERAEASLTLKQGELKFRSYFENSPVAVFVVDRNGCYVDCNAAAEALLGYSPAELSRLRVPELHPPEDQSAVMEQFAALLQHGRIDLECRLVKADGAAIWVSLRAALLADGHGLAYCQDITEQKQAVQSLGERLSLREQLATVAATVPGVIYSFRARPDGSSCFPYASPALEQLCGVRPEQAAEDAASVLSRVHPDDADRIRRTGALSARTLSPWQEQFRINHPRRGEIWVEGHSVPQREPDGGTLWHGFFYDVTDRRLSEQALRNSEERLRTLLEQAGDAFFVHGLDGKFLEVNRHACESLGYTRQELLQMGVFDIEKVLDPEKVRRAWENVEPGRYLTLRGRQRRKDGSLLPVEVRLGCYRDNDRLIMVALVRDITERLRREEELREASRRMELAITAGGFGVWDLDVASDRLHWNERMFELYGLTPKEFDHNRQSWVNSLHPEDHNRVLAQGEAALAGEAEFDTEFRVVHPDGKVKSLKAMAVVVRDAQGSPLRMIGLNRDITEQRSLEAQLIQAQKMEAVGRLAGGVAHDFNNNLTVILGYAELSRLVAIGSETFHEYLGEIMKAAEHSRDITQQLLAFSRNEIIAPRQVDLNLLIRKTEKTLARLIGEDVRLGLNLSEGLWPVLIDPAQLNQIVMNLAVNSRDAMPAGGTLRIETRNLQLDAMYCQSNPQARPGDWVQLTVSDSGVGMDREMLGHIFEPFYTTKGVGKGTGLGLATVYGIVRQNDGFIQVFSEPGQGAVFALFFPRLFQEQNTEVETEPAPPAGEGVVLLVEDEVSVRQMVRLMLEKAGYSVLAASTPADALEICRKGEQRIDCLLTDVIMPGMNGVELTAAVRKLRPDIGMVYMSGYTADMIAHHGVLSQGVSFVQKPFDVKSLSGKIQEAILLSR